MSWTIKSIADWISKILVPIMELVSPVIRQELEKFLTDLYRQSLQTENPWDDLVVKFFLDMLKIPVPEV